MTMGISQGWSSPLGGQTDIHELLPALHCPFSLKDFSEGYKADFLQPKPAAPYVTLRRWGTPVIDLAVTPLGYLNDILMYPLVSKLQSALHLATPAWPPLKTSAPSACFAPYS